MFKTMFFMLVCLLSNFWNGEIKLYDPSREFNNIILELDKIEEKGEMLPSFDVFDSCVDRLDAYSNSTRKRFMSDVAKVKLMTAKSASTIAKRVKRHLTYDEMCSLDYSYPSNFFNNNNNPLIFLGWLMEGRLND